MGVEDRSVGPLACIGFRHVVERPGQLVQVGQASPPRFDREGGRIEADDLVPAVLELGHQLTTHAAPHRREQVQHGVGAVLARPLHDELPRRRHQVDEEGWARAPVAALPPGQPACDTDETGQDGLQDGARDQRIELAASEQRLDDAGCACRVVGGSARSQPPNEFDEVPCDHRGDRWLAGGELSEDRDGGRRAAATPPVSLESVNGAERFRHAREGAVDTSPDPSHRRQYSADVDIEEFYDADPRRRASAEVEMGTDWRDAGGVRYELSWVEDTGELYMLREPVPGGWADPFGGIHASGTHDVDQREVQGMTLAVLGTIATQEEVEHDLEGWEDAMRGANSVQWLTDRLRERGVLR